MSVDHFSGVSAPNVIDAAPLFLSVKPGQFVIVQDTPPTGRQAQTDGWWMGQVIWCEGGARDPKANSLFQIADVDDGTVRWVNADLVTHVVHGLDGLNN